MAQTKQKGFYVSQGEVQLLKEKGDGSATPSKGGKPKSSVGKDKGSGAEDGAKSGGKDSTTTGGKRKKGDTGDDTPGYLGGYAHDGRKRRKIEAEEFSAELQAMFDDIKEKSGHGGFFIVFFFECIYA